RLLHVDEVTRGLDGRGGRGAREVVAVVAVDRRLDRGLQLTRGAGLDRLDGGVGAGVRLADRQLHLLGAVAVVLVRLPVGPGQLAGDRDGLALLHRLRGGVDGQAGDALDLGGAHRALVGELLGGVVQRQRARPPGAGVGVDQLVVRGVDVDLALAGGGGRRGGGAGGRVDRKSTRLNSSHVKISYAVFCLK